MSNVERVLVPDIGDFAGVEVIDVLVKVGDWVEQESSLITLESDKAAMDIPSPLTGRVQEIAIKVGDSVTEGDLLLSIETEQAPAVSAEPDSENGEAESKPEMPVVPLEERAPVRTAPGDKIPTAPPVVAQPVDLPGHKAHASPTVRQFARELGVDLFQVVGSGTKSRILKTDVKSHVKRVLSGATVSRTSTGTLGLPALPEVDFSKFGEIEIEPLGRIKKISGAHLSACWLNIPHVTQFDEADITELEAFRQVQKEEAAKQEVRLTLLPFLMKACVGLLREMPLFNSSLSPDKESLILKRYFHIGVAVDTPNGLMVPVIRDVDSKGVYQLSRELMAISERAREGKLMPADLQGGCFSISSLGGIGGTAFTPIVNAPEVAILGVSRSAMKPVWDGAEFQPRLMLPLSLSYDHRVIDGAQAARFTSRLSSLLTDIRKLLL
ncbi:MAG: dihydrolipoyllysine-residue acetyltransferase [Gammaproteobacteria bacterium]|nr:dihydrolipoyllysine-residue acetyltransferase [Gammaproteobacteria bacterium]